ncbi:MAG: four helix bundle protein [Selenomonadaceae bacterium]|nr:four helix bundle protein [Selenomonadaceae bacterium]
MHIRSYKDLTVWQKSMDLTVEVYQLVKLLPKEETYALADQMRRAVVSIPSNIAEGQERNSTRDFLRFLSIARGSQAELETQLQICERLNYISAEKLQIAFGLCDEVNKMLNVFISKLKNKLTTDN